MPGSNALKFQVSRSVGGLVIWLCLTLSLAMIFETLAEDSVKPAYSSIPRIDRNLLLGFLADNRTLTLIDARSPEEFAELHLPGAVNIPFDAVEAHSELLPADTDKPVVVYCRTGRRAGLLKEQLIARGYTDVQVLPREQIYWHDDFMALNCGDDGGSSGPGEVLQPKSTNEQN